MNIVSGFKPVAKTDNGICERCGTLCPKQTVLMASCDAEGNIDGCVTAHWGVCCAAQYCFGTKTERNRKRVLALVEEYEQEKRYQEEAWTARIATGTVQVWWEWKSTGSGYRYKTDPVNIDHGSVMAHANALFARTGRPLFGTFAMAHADGRIVKTTGEAGEVAYYTAAGFVQCTVPSNILPARSSEQVHHSTRQGFEG